METKIRGFQNPKPGSKAAPPQQRGLSPLFPEHEIVRLGPRRQGISLASLRALDGSGPSLGTHCKGGNCNGGERIHQNAVAQRSGFATPGTRTGFQGIRSCTTVLHYWIDWRRVSARRILHPPALTPGSLPVLSNRRIVASGSPAKRTASLTVRKSLSLSGTSAPDTSD